ncbi:unnamed protein product [Somion occarium]|uniref:Eukaryotic mitochondrial regulator protein-domain-containing protein n=2 Tax=Somion occarium TaxID=3059160 RepID=A0ABP1CFY0_9APHY
MFALLRNLSLFPRASTSCSIIRHSRRHLTYTQACKAEIVVEPSFEGADIFEGEDVPENADELLNGREEPQEDDEKRSSRDPPYEQWLNTTGKQFKEPHRPRNWLGGQVPFPLNPSFKPPTPASDELRSLIYTQYMANPEGNSVRALAERFGLSIKRVDAILRLKGLEEHWKKGKQLQTGFQVGMEEILGVAQDRQTRRSLTRGADELGEDTTAADLQLEAEGSDSARDRYQRMFWEPVAEGKDAIVAEALDAARAYAQKHRQMSEEQKNDPELLGLRPSTLVIDKVKLVIRENRPTMKFVDVGGRFLDVNDRVRRIKESERRSRIKAKRREPKAQEVKTTDADAEV